MAENNPTRLIVRQPSQYKQGDDFLTWAAQFFNFAEAMAIAKKDQFAALCTYLDSVSFSMVQELALAEDEKPDPAKFRQLLEKALQPVDKIPPRLALKYRAQEVNESLHDFSVALRKLAGKASIPADSREQMLVDSFCTGVRDSDTSIKLLATTFETLSLAVEKGQKFEAATKIRNFVRPNNIPTETDLEILATNPAPQSESAHVLESRGSATDWSTQADARTAQSQVNASHSVDPNPQNFATNNYNSAPFLPQNFAVQNFAPPQYARQDFVPQTLHPGQILQVAPYPNQYNSAGFRHPNSTRDYNRRPQNNHANKQCYYCNIWGHIKSQCRKKKRDDENSRPSQAGPSPRNYLPSQMHRYNNFHSGPSPRLNPHQEPFIPQQGPRPQGQTQNFLSGPSPQQ